MYQNFYRDSTKIQNAHDGSKFTSGIVLCVEIFTSNLQFFLIMTKKLFLEMTNKYYFEASIVNAPAETTVHH